MLLGKQHEEYCVTLLLVIKASYRKSTRELSVAINQVDKAVKNYCLSVINSDIEQYS